MLLSAINTDSQGLSYRSDFAGRFGDVLIEIREADSERAAIMGVQSLTRSGPDDIVMADHALRRIEALASHQALAEFGLSPLRDDRVSG